VSFARAAHDGTPPPELKDRVMTVLQQEWQNRAAQEPAAAQRGRWIAWAAGVAAAALVVATLVWGGSQAHRANLASEAAASYGRLVHTLGGTEFRIGTLRPGTTQPVDGSVVMYDSSHGQSWAMVLVRAPGMTGTADVSLEARDGRTIDLRELEFQPGGDAS